MIPIHEWTRDWSVGKKSELTTHDYEVVTSTNDEAKNLSYSDQQCHLFLTKSQTQGRGRANHRWLDSSHGTNFIATFSFHSAQAPHPLLAPRLGLIFYNTTKIVWPQLKWSLKAPNDLYIEDKKVAGILCETVSMSNEHRICIGIGFNISTSPKELQTASYLLNYLDALLRPQWLLFLEQFWQEQKKMIATCALSSLSQVECEELRTALNLHPYLANTLGEPVIEVTSEGSLVLQNKKISWHDL